MFAALPPAWKRSEKMRIRSRKDLYAGLVFIAFGVGFALVSQNYPMGTSKNVGPGYFPALLGIILAVLGLLVIGRAALVDNPASVRLALRPLLLVMAGAVLFAFLISRVGLLAALAGLIFVSALGGAEFRFREVAVLWVALSVLAVAVFVYGLGLPFKVWPL
jgi:hypothetical protein